MNRQRGSLLIITLWLVTILSALSVAVARYLSTEVRLTRYRLARQEAGELARSGVLLALDLIQQDPTPMEDWSGEPWAAPQTVSPAAGRQLTVTITDEERKLNVNTATVEQLSSLLGDAALAQAIVDYLDAPDPAEDRLTEEPPYYAKNGPAAVLDELSDVPGLTGESRETLAAFTTPFTSSATTGGPLNINTATRQAMLAFGLSEYTVSIIEEVRNGPNGRFERPEDILPTLQGLGWTIADPQQSMKEQALLSAMTTSSSVFTVVSEGIVESPDVHVHIQAVLERSTGKTSPKIIAWRES